MKISQFDFDSRKEGAEPGTNAFVSLDGTDFAITAQGGYNPDFFSHKFKGPGLRYEVGLNVATGQIVWVHGGYPCGAYPDLKIARERFVQQLDENERAFADNGYPDRKYFLTPNYYPEQEIAIQRVMRRHETVNERLKNFNILSNKFRHSIFKHFSCFYAVSLVVQMNILQGDNLYDV